MMIVNDSRREHLEDLRLLPQLRVVAKPEDEYRNSGSAVMPGKAHSVLAMDVG